MGAFDVMRKESNAQTHGHPSLRFEFEIVYSVHLLFDKDPDCEKDWLYTPFRLATTRKVITLPRAARPRTVLKKAPEMEMKTIITRIQFVAVLKSK